MFSSMIALFIGLGQTGLGYVRLGFVVNMPAIGTFLLLIPFPNGAYFKLFLW